MSGKCRYCRRQSTRRVVLNLGPFCEVHWAMLLGYLAQFAKEAASGKAE